MATRLRQGRVTSKKKLLERISKLNIEAEKKGVTRERIRDIFLSASDQQSNAKNAKRKRENKLKNKNGNLKVHSVAIGVTILTALLGYYVLDIRTWNDFKLKCLLGENTCVIKNNDYFNAMIRPLVNCDMCRSLMEVPVVWNISIEEFKAKYAYTSVPVLIKGATKDWKAMSTFSFDWFKNLYQQTPGAFYDTKGDKCLYFMKYSTKFDTLEDVFKMPDNRAKGKEGERPWYIGWMTCKTDIKEVMRQHYTRPYFLPNDTESSTVNWVFMGTPGHGVGIHLDEEVRPSWQAQISGTKTWTLVPVPECESVCRSMNVTVHKGDIVVLNVNHWYHSTFVSPGELSIAIGSEYD